MRLKWLLVSGFFGVGLLLLPFSYSSETYTSPTAYLEESGPLVAQTNAAGGDSPWALESIWFSVLRQVEGVLDFAAQTIQAVGEAPNELFDIESNNPPDSQADAQGFDPLINAANQLPAVTAPQAYEGTLIFNVPVSVRGNLTVDGQTNITDLFVSGEFSINNLTVPGSGSFGSVAAGGAQFAGLSVSGDTQLNTLSVSGPVSFNDLTAGTLQVTNELSADGGITTNGADVDLEGGNIFAANIVNEIIAGDDIEITGPPNAPIISADVRVPSIGSRVRTLNGINGTLTLTGGSGIIITESGTDITIANSSGLGTYLGLTDTPGSYATGSIPFVNATSSGMTQSTNLTFDGTQLSIGGSVPVTTLTINGDASVLNRQVMRFYETTNTNFVGFRASTTLAGDTIWTLPAADGNADEIIATDGAGNLRFLDPAALGFVSELDDLTDVTITASTTGDILRFNGSQWVNASSASLGLGDNTFLGLTDTPSSYVTGGLSFVNASGTALTQSTNFTFNGSQFAVGTSAPVTTLTVNGDASVLGAQAVRFYDAASANHVGFRASSTLPGDLVWTLPTIDGNANEFIVTDGAGNLRFADASILGGVTELNDLSDVTLATTTAGEVLVFDGTDWVNQATSTLGLGDNTFVGLSDTPSSYTSDAVIFANAAGTALSQSTNFTFDGTQVNIGGGTAVTTLTLNGDASVLGAQAVRFYETDNSNFVGFRASSTLAGDQVWTLPVADGTNNQILVTDGAGNLSFADVSAIGGGATTYLGLNDTPASYIANAIPYASSSATELLFSSSLVFDGTNVGIGTNSPTEELTVHGSVFLGLNDSTPGLVLQANDTEVGIGVVDPTEQLHVEGGSILQRGGTSTALYTPEVVSAIELNRNVNKIFVQGTRAYLATNNSTQELTIIDITDRGNPTTLGSANLAATARDVYVKGNYAYLVSDITGNDFHVVDVSDPTAPTEVGSLPLPTSARGVTVRGRWAYVTNENSADQFHIIDVAVPSNPVEVGSVSISADVNDVKIKGDHAFVVTDTPDALISVDISDPTSPTVSGTTTFLSNLVALQIKGDYAYVVGGPTDDELFIVDISDPTSMTSVGSIDLLSAATDISLSGSYAYISTSGTGDDLRVIDISDQTNPVEVGGVDLSVPLNAIQIIGRYAYLGSGNTSNDFHIFDVTGVEAQTVLAHSLESGSLSVIGDIIAEGTLELGDSLTSGVGGLLTEGSLFVRGTGDSIIMGDVGIGTTSPADVLHVAGDIRVGLGTTGCVKDADGTTISGTCSSDERLKTDITPLGLGSTEYLEAIVALEPVTYCWNDIAGELFTYGGAETQTGLIAQQVEGVLPELVANSSDGFKQVRFSDIPIYLIQAIKEMWAIVTGNQEKIDALEERLQLLETMLDVEPVTAPSDEGDDEEETEEEATEDTEETGEGEDDEVPDVTATTTASTTDSTDTFEDEEYDTETSTSTTTTETEPAEGGAEDDDSETDVTEENEADDDSESEDEEDTTEAESEPAEGDEELADDENDGLEP